MIKTANAWGGDYLDEEITCEIVGELNSGRKIWASVDECGHHEGLYTFHTLTSRNRRLAYFVPVNPDPYDWTYYNHYNPC